MFFCEKCNYLYNVTKTVQGESMVEAGEKERKKVFEKFRKKTPLVEEDLMNMRLADLTESPEYLKLPEARQKIFLEELKALTPHLFTDQGEPTGRAYFICHHCQNQRPIKPGTIIYAKNYDSTAILDEYDYDQLADSPILPRTKAYICPNSKCPTQKSPNKKEAVFLKNELSQLIYVCCICRTHWLNSL